MGKWLENRYFFVTPPRGMAAPAEPWPPRRRPPNFALEVWVARPTELYWFSDFYASASWSRDALSEKMGVLISLRYSLDAYYESIILPLFGRNMRDMVLTYQAWLTK
jgi:hypothetical protein